MVQRESFALNRFVLHAEDDARPVRCNVEAGYHDQWWGRSCADDYFIRLAMLNREGVQTHFHTS
jgi:hypothetical protein